jgi:hypothetical protein
VTVAIVLIDSRPDLTALAAPVCIVCCDDDTALCGRDVSSDPWTPDDDVTCVVCLDLENQPCAITCTLGGDE